MESQLQTIAAPVLTAVLYLLIFGHVLEDHVKVYDRMGYVAFLVPGLVMMSVLQNAFANSSSSLIQKQDHGQPGVCAAHAAVALALVRAPTWAPPMLRGLVVGLGVFIVTLAFARPRVCGAAVDHRLCRAGALLLGVLGLIAGCGPTSSTRWRRSRTSSSCP